MVSLLHIRRTKRKIGNKQYGIAAINPKSANCTLTHTFQLYKTQIYPTLKFIHSTHFYS